MFLLVWNCLLVAALAYIIIDAVISYRAAVGTVWQRLLAAGKESATILWARFTVVVGVVVNGLVWMADVLHAPEVANAIQTYGGPKAAAAVLIVVAVITEMARRRTL
jgi:hypothetical protein